MAQNDTSYVEVAETFLVMDVYANSYYATEMDIDVLYENHKEWVKLYFPQILEEYDLTLYTQFSMAILLYLEGEETYLSELWLKYERISINKEFKPILYLLSFYEIDLDKLSTKEK